MRGDTGTVAVYVHFCRSIDYFYLLADILLAGNAVIMGILAQPYMPVLHDGQHNRLPEFITYRGEFPQYRTFNLLELLPAAVITSDKRCAVVYFQDYADGRIQGRKVMEHTSFQIRVNAAVDQFDGAFSQSLVARFVGPGRRDGTAVMFGEGGEVIVQGGFITAAFGHGGLQVVRYDGPEGFRRSNAGRPHRLLSGLPSSGS